MFKVPFSLYDFFGYLSAGLIILAGADFALDLGIISLVGSSTVYLAVTIVAVYVLGHINANISSWFLEHTIVGRILGNPALVFFETKYPKWKAFRWVFPGYFKALPSGVKDRVLSLLKQRNITTESFVIFHHARTIAKREPVTWSRLETFLSLYGFCRNISCSLILLAALFGFETMVCGKEQGYYALFSLLAAFGMFYRYLKFYRQFSFELFTAYPDLEYTDKKAEVD